MNQNGETFYLGNNRVDVDAQSHNTISIHVFSDGHPHTFALAVKGGSPVNLVNNFGGACYKYIDGAAVNGILML